MLNLNLESPEMTANHACSNGSQPQPLSRVHFNSTRDIIDREPQQDETTSRARNHSAARSHSLASLASFSSTSSSTSGFSTNNEATIPADHKHACSRPSVISIKTSGDRGEVDKKTDPKDESFETNSFPQDKEKSSSKSVDKLNFTGLEKSDPEVTVQIEKSENNKDNDNNNNDPAGKSTKSTKRLVRRFKGIGFTLVSSFFFSVTTVIVKYVKDVSSAELALFRFLGIFFMALPVAWEQGTNIFGAPDMRIFLILRGLAGATSLFCRYSALTYMSLADTTIIILSMPVFVFIFARIFLGERFSRYHVLATVLSIVGIIFASKLDIFFSDETEAESTISIHNTSTTTSVMSDFTTSESINTTTVVELSKTKKRLYGTIFSCGSMLIGSFVYVITRKVRSTHYSVILVNFAIVAMSEMTIINLSFYRFTLPTIGYTPWLIALLAIFSFYGQLFLTKAIQVEEAGVVSVIRVSGEALFAFVFQITIFHEMPDQFTIIGAVLVMASVFLLSFRKYILGLPDDSPLKNKLRFLTK